MGFLDEMDCIAQIDSVEVRQMFSTPGDLGLFDGDSSVSIEQQLRHFGACQPLAIGLDNRRIVSRCAVERHLAWPLEDGLTAGDGWESRSVVGEDFGTHFGERQIGEHLPQEDVGNADHQPPAAG